MTLLVGGVEATLAQIDQAADVLEAWTSTTIRPVLAPLGNPLAWCDYRAVARPYKPQFDAVRHGTRGAAGNPATKLAFIYALREIARSARAEPVSMFRSLVSSALAAFSSDETYAAEIAREAVKAGKARHTASLRSQLRQAAHQAVSACEARAGQFTCTTASACGTGACRFAPDHLRVISAPAGPGRAARPANHAAGGGFDPLGALAELEARRPYVVAVMVSDHDEGYARDEVAV